MRTLCVGSAVVDIITIVASRDVERMTMHNATSSFLLFEQGRKIVAESISPHIGGGGVNAAVAMRRLGAEAAILVKIGRDPNGDMVRDRLTEEMVDDSFVIETDTDATGTAVMVSSHDRNATIFVRRGANTLLVPAEITEMALDGRDLVFISNLSDRSADCFPLIAEHAHRAGAFVSSNPGIRQLTSRTDVLFETLPHIDLLSINRVEAEALVPTLTGKLDNLSPKRRLAGTADGPRLMHLGLSMNSFDMELPNFMAAMLEFGGVRRMIVTDGTEGAYLADAEGLHYCPALAVEVKGTAGAGDAFVSTVSFYLAQGATASDAMQFAACNAAGVVGEVDTQKGLMDQPSLTAFRDRQAKELETRFWPWR